MENLGPPTRESAATSNATLPRHLGEYRLVREVGRGGMGVVYEAVQESLGRRVAVKVLPANLLDDKHRERFQREAKAAARLHHTNIVPVFGVGEHDGQPFYVMQFIDGRGLDAVLRDVKAARGERRRDDNRHFRRRAVPVRPRGCSPLPSIPTRTPRRDREPRRNRASGVGRANRMRRTSARRRGWACKRRKPWPTRTGKACCTATSNRPICCSTPKGHCGSPTSVWPRPTTMPTT